MNFQKSFNIQGTCFEHVYNKVHEDKKKKIILVTGASSSGKGFLVESLKEELESKGKRVASFSADMYYKGIAPTIVEKALLKYPELESIKEKEKEITKIVRDITIESPFPQKFCDENVSKLNEELGYFLPPDIVPKLIEKLKYEKDNIDFDEPFAIDFESLKRDINTLVNDGNKEVIVPAYTFRTGEIEFKKENTIKGNDYDNIIIEGLYTLRDELLEGLDQKNIFKMALNCDLKTILIRRFNRDIKSDRCSFTPEQTILFFITKVMPAFYNYILPTFSKADIMYNTSLTKAEIENREQQVQFKYKTMKEIYALLEFYGAKLLKKENHRDYFLEDTTKDKQNNIIVRLREQNREINKLTIKLESYKSMKTIEEYDLEKILSAENKEPELFIQRLENSGYETTEIVNKERSVYDLDGTLIKVDNVKGLGYFIEIDKKALSNIEQLNKLKVKLLLNNYTFSSYYDMFKDYNNFIKTETEKKYLIYGLKEGEVSKGARLEIQKQYYLDKDQKECLKLLKKSFTNLDIKSVAEARIRLTNGRTFEICFKGEGDISRDEIEKETSKAYAEKLIEYSKNSLEKDRYRIFKDSDKTVFVDFYRYGDLCKLEIEYDPNKLLEKQIDAFAEKLIKDSYGEKIHIEDVTRISKYKNSNLVKEMERYANN
ncbi:MAG: CYTH domain-containing protein [Clostridia bacterium]|nr:CYTH domain-containing protein [Clostridia bacterium]